MGKLHVLIILTGIKSYFCPMFFSPIYICKQFHSVLNLAKHSCVKREIVWNFWICLVMNSPADNECQRGKNKNQPQKRGWTRQTNNLSESKLKKFNTDLSSNPLKKTKRSKKDNSVGLVISSINKLWDL